MAWWNLVRLVEFEIRGGGIIRCVTPNGCCWDRIIKWSWHKQLQRSFLGTKLISYTGKKICKLLHRLRCVATFVKKLSSFVPFFTKKRCFTTYSSMAASVQKDFYQFTQLLHKRKKAKARNVAPNGNNTPARSNFQAMFCFCIALLVLLIQKGVYYKCLYQALFENITAPRCCVFPGSTCKEAIKRTSRSGFFPIASFISV